MKKTIFVTGVTRMREGFVCVSGIDIQTGDFVRPEIHYKERPGIKKEFLYGPNNEVIIRPLAVVELDFLRYDPKSAFHTEDWEINGKVPPRLVAIPTDDQKRRILAQHTDDSLDIALAEQSRSLVIVRPQGVPDLSVRVYDGRIKSRMGFRDQAGALHNLPVTDANWLAVVRYLWVHYHDTMYGRLKNALADKEIYLRIGVTREWQGQVWRQISGVFSIPDWLGGHTFADYQYDFSDEV